MCRGQPAVAGTPVASVKTTPLTMRGVAGAARSCETHPGSSASAPPLSLSFIASTAPVAIGPFVAGIPLASLPATGSRIHVTPPAVVGRLRRLRRRTGSSSGLTAWHATRRARRRSPPRPFRAPSSTRAAASRDRHRQVTSHRAATRARPCVAAVTISRSPCRRIVGPVTNSAAGCVNQSFTLQCLRIERDDGVRLAVAGSLARTDRGDQSAVGGERHGADDGSAVRVPRHHRFRVAVEIDGADRRRRSAAAARRSRHTASCPPRSAIDHARWRAGRPRAAACPCPTAGRARAACRRWRRRRRRRTGGRGNRTRTPPPCARLPTRVRATIPESDPDPVPSAPEAPARRRAARPPVRAPRAPRRRAGAAAGSLVAPVRPLGLRPARPRRARRQAAVAAAPRPGSDGGRIAHGVVRAGRCGSRRR